MRIAKALAAAGIGSRRVCEKYVLEGKVTLNGQPVFDLGRQVDLDKDTLMFKRKKVRLQEPVYFMTNKPKGFVSTASDKYAKKTVYELLPPDLAQAATKKQKTRVFTVGRLDKDSTGLLLFTNNGELANRLMHPKYHVEKWYEVRLDKPLKPEDEAKLVKGIWLSDGRAKIKSIKRKTDTIVKVMLTEGINRQVRRMFAKLDYKVKALHRISYGPLVLSGMSYGTGRYLKVSEIKALKKSVSMG